MSPRPRFQNHLVFITFHNRIFVVYVFNKISNGMLVTIGKELRKYFQLSHFWNHWAPLIRTRYLDHFTLKISWQQPTSGLKQLISGWLGSIGPYPLRVLILYDCRKQSYRKGKIPQSMPEKLWQFFLDVFLNKFFDFFWQFFSL